MITSKGKGLYRLAALAALSGLTSVVILAMASHALPKILDLNKVSAITTAAQIQLFHAILVASLFHLNNVTSKVKFSLALKLIFSGSIIFSISIYLLSFREIINLPQLKILGPITPLGGILLIVGWALLSIRFFQLSVLKDEVD